MTEWNDEREPRHEPEGGTGKVLFYFFALVALCAVALAVGYMMGKRTSPATAETGAPAATTTAAASGAAKPGPSRALDAAPAQATPSPMATPAASSSPSPSPTTAVNTTKPAEKTATEAKPTAAANLAPEMGGAALKGFMVQVAAVSRQEDADALAGALRKKQYPVFVMPGTGTDKLLHVQVGPFAELKDAEAMKAKLAADGYNAIVKK